MTKKVWLITAVALVIVVASGTRAQEPTAPQVSPRDMLKSVDANADGKITFEEYSAAHPGAKRKTFDLLDKNKDGVVSKDELPKPPAAPAPPHPIFAKFREADKDGNGKVTLEEAQAAVPDLTKEKFAQLDTNGDGVLSRQDQLPAKPTPPLFTRLLMSDKDRDGKVSLEEAQAAVPDITKERFGALDKNGDGVFSSEDIAAVQSTPSLVTRLLQADKDGDGKVTLEEAQTVMPKLTPDRFLTLDKNGDGVVTQDDNVRGRFHMNRMPSLMESNKGRAGLVAGADSDGDGKVTLEEMKAFRPTISKEAFDRLDTDRDGVITEKDTPVRTIERPDITGKDGVVGPASGLLGRMAGADLNGDGKTTRLEAKEALPNMPDDVFDRLDVNKDGVISKEDTQPPRPKPPRKPKPPRPTTLPEPPKMPEPPKPPTLPEPPKLPE